MAGTHAGRVNRPSPWPWLVPVAALVAGTLFASSVRASQGEDLRTDQAQLPDLIRAQNRTNEARDSQLDDLQGQVDEATAGLAPGDLQTQKLERQANEIATAAGRTPCAARPCGSPSTTPSSPVARCRPARPRRLRHPPAGRAVGGQRAVAGRRRGDDAPGPAGGLTSAGVRPTRSSCRTGRSPPYVITAIGDRTPCALARHRPGRREPARCRSRSARLRREQRRAEDLPGLQRLDRAGARRSPRLVRLRRVVGWSGEVLVTMGVLLLLFAAWQLWWTDVVADRAQAQIVQTLEDDFARGTPGPVATTASRGDRQGRRVRRRAHPRSAATCATGHRGHRAPVLALGSGTTSVPPGRGSRQLRRRRAPHDLRAALPRRRPARRRRPGGRRTAARSTSTSHRCARSCAPATSRSSTRCPATRRARPPRR